MQTNIIAQKELKFREYPILCPSCGEPIACYTKEYETILSQGGMTREETLDYLGILTPCSRIVIMNPTYIRYNPQNNEVMEGLKTPQEINIFNNNPYTNKNLVYNACLPAANKDFTNDENLNEDSEEDFDVKKHKNLFDSDEEGENELTKSKESDTKIIIVKESKSNKHNIILDALDQNLEDDAIPIANTFGKKLNYPTIPGMATINKNPFVSDTYQFVGDNRKVTILSGRTYLAR